MTDAGGYANRIAKVDLTKRQVLYEEIDDKLARKYIGGRGLGVKYVFDNGTDVEPLSEANILCLMIGPLTGSDASLNCRLASVTKSPLTGTIVDSHSGGYFGSTLKWAGFDGLIFEGQSEKPLYAYIENEKLELRDASDLWGKGVFETTDTLRDRLGNVNVLSIGIAGENLVKFANIMNDAGRANGRGGTGAVMGFKKLKAVVVKAKMNRVKPKNRDLWAKARKEALDKVMTAPVTEPGEGGLSEHGTAVCVNEINERGSLPTRNSQFTMFDKAEDISGETMTDTILIDRPACDLCPVACKRLTEVKDGKWAYRGEGPEYETIWALGANCGNGDLKAIGYMNDLLNDLGMDTIEMGDVLAVAMEASQRDLLKDGIEWGDADKMVELIKKTAKREDVGWALAEGTLGAAKIFGNTGIAMAVKGMGIPAYDPRGIKGMGLGFATSNRGACHLRGYTPTYEVFGEDVPHAELMDRLAWQGKAELLKFLQDWFAFVDSLNVCVFSTFAWPTEVYAKLASAMTGWDISVEEMLRIGERIYNLERHYNNLCGFTAKDDQLPKRFLEEPPTEKPSKGSLCELDKMLEEYYKLRDWENGIVKEEKLKELEII
ncbi:MAG: aldehyde ferredoxin oxidoreductase [Nitrososphaeria archaeon]|nr:aldehyde ferredoxin oxidoreductase [Nitrososphaeria archaeon]NIN53353.1 aldehyde ferredoxin oxidoreductase [Nitrososphaeria archaeon]NIQ33819.1 aldehyde ferredoxin oxidoreductase [Nitrososphaeria archaeon]